MDIMTNEPGSFVFFPDNCQKRVPPKLYFWKVYSILFLSNYRTVIDGALRNAQGTNHIPDKITVDPEMALILGSLDNSRSITYARLIISRKKRKSFKGIVLYWQKSQKVLHGRKCQKHKLGKNE